MGEPTLDQRTPTLRLKYSAEAGLNFNWDKIDDAFRMLLAMVTTPGGPSGGFMPVTIVPVTGQGNLTLDVAKVVATVTPDPSAANHTMLLLGVINVLSSGGGVSPGEQAAWNMKIEVGPAGAAAYLSTLMAGIFSPVSVGNNSAVLIPIVTGFDIPMTPVPINVTLTSIVPGTAALVVGVGHLVAIVL